MAPDTTPLSSRHCQACRGDTPPLSPADSEQLLTYLSDKWELDTPLRTLLGTFRFDNYYQTLAFVNAVAWIAHREDHHPDLEVGYNRCQVRYHTHAIDGLSENDFICAAKIDTLGQPGSG